MRLYISIILFLAALFVIPGGFSFAKIYKWVDEKGGIHFSNTLPSEKQEHSDSIRPVSLSTRTHSSCPSASVRPKTFNHISI